VRRRILVGLALATFALECGGRTGLGAGERTSAGTCSDVPSAPTSIATVGEVGQYPRVGSMTVVGPTLYYSVYDGSNSPLALRRVSLAGGTPEDVVAGKGGCDTSSPLGYGPLVTDGRRVFTTDIASVGCSGYARHVTVYDDATDVLSSLENPAGAGVDRAVMALRALPGGGVAWIVRSLGPEPGVLAAWDGSGEPRVVAPIPALGMGLLVVGADAFVHHVANGQAALDRVALATGATTTVATFPAKDFRLVGANDDAIFYTTDGKTLTRRVVATGTTNAVDAEVTGAAWIDGDDVYFVRQPPPNDFTVHLRRASARGGPSAPVHDDPARNQVQAITGDGCRLVFAVGPDFTNRKPVAIVRQRR
jgi:hypothetical protein